MISVADLRRNTLFAGVKISELRRILPTLRKEYYPRSALICKEGEPGTCLYVILSGQVKLSATEDSHTSALSYMNAGDFFGENAVLTNELRAVTAEAVIDAEIVLLGQQSFHDLVERDPTIMHNIIRSVDQRIRKKTLGLFHQQPKQSQLVSIYSPKKTPGKTFLAVHLAESLVKQTSQPVVVLDMTMNPPNIAQILRMEGAGAIGEDELSEEYLKRFFYQHASGFYLVTLSPDLLKAGKISRERIAGILSILKTSFHYVLLNTSTEISNNTFEALDLSDTVVLLSPVGEEPPTGMFDHQEIFTVLYSPDVSPQLLPSSSEMAPLILPLESRSTQQFYEEGNILPALPAHKHIADVIHQIARRVANLRVGLALGGMAARGLSHIGVLKVLERNNILIDMIAASNTGAIIGTLFALGMTATEIEELTLEFGQHLSNVSFQDVSLFGGGLLSQRRIIKRLSAYIPERLTFHDVKIPLRIITMALHDGKEVPIVSGSLLKAIEASLAMPGIFPPVQCDDKFLLDGSTINPVPISDLIEMDADVLVGVNGFSRLSPTYTPPPEQYVNLVGYAENMKMIDIITRSFQNLQYEISTAKAMIADVTIIPKLLGYTWVDFKHAGGIIEAGEKAAEEMLPELKAVIENRRLYRRI